MTVSKKQLEANKRNAQKGGVKTQEGKAIVKYNALKHGLLAKEAVITVGEGAESPEEFNALLTDLKTQLNPAGTLEEKLVEKVVVAYWRLRRAYKYEVGLIREELDTATEDFYSREYNKTDEEIDQEIEKIRKLLNLGRKTKEILIRCAKRVDLLKKFTIGTTTGNGWRKRFNIWWPGMKTMMDSTRRASENP